MSLDVVLIWHLDFIPARCGIYVGFFVLHHLD